MAALTHPASGTGRVGADATGAYDADPRRFILANLPRRPVTGIPEISLHLAAPSSALWRLTGRAGTGAPPYWAYPWGGGLALARHVLDNSGCVAGLRVLDLGAGSGLVGIAAAMSGARAVRAAEIDPTANCAIELNASANGVAVEVSQGDLTRAPPPQVDVVLVGDLFYERGLARRVTAFLDRCLLSGIAVLVGDPWRSHLPRRRLRLVGEYRVADFGDSAGTVRKPAGVFSFEPPRRTAATGVRPA